MSRLDHLRELLNERGDATGVIERDVGDVHRRARRHHKPSALAGALTSIAVAITVALVVTAIGVEHFHHDQQVTSSSVDRDDYGPTSTQAISETRDLAGGVQLHASMPAPIVAFGPYDPSERWTEPLSCPVSVDVSLVSGGGSQQVITVAGLSRAARAQISLTAWQGPDVIDADASKIVRTFVAAISHPTAGETYRLLSGNDVLDQAGANGGLLVLIGTEPADPADSSPAVAAGAVGDIHVQQLRGAQLVDDQPVRPPADRTMPARCSPPASPAGLTASAPLDPADTAAVTSVVASLFPTGGSLSDGLAHVDDPQGRIHHYLAGQHPQGLNLLVTAEDVHPVSPTEAWVRSAVQPGVGSPAIAVGWVRVDKIDGAWTASGTSYCALIATLGLACAGAPPYTPLTASGQHVQVPNDTAAAATTTTAG